ncbi:MAG TPA: VOC family protein [Thermoleophilaceae bacterium]|nr:VOC family protein [Thermoleophilaceae bacterium]
MSLITGTDFLIIGSTDVDRSVKFYDEVLGLERGKQWGNMPGYEFETGNLTIAVMQSDAFGLEFKPNTHPLEFRVEDFDAAKSELESKGVEFEGDTIDSGVCHQAFFRDPDGNALGIHHRYAEGAPPAPGS